MRKILLFILLLSLVAVACAQQPATGGGNENAATVPRKRPNKKPHGLK